MAEVELSALDLRYESYRLRQSIQEEQLLTSIAQRGIEEPLEGVDVEGTSILLNGFKRYRCAKKLKIGTVPYESLGTDEVTGIVNLLRISNDKALGILEQAAFVDELKNVRDMSIGEIAQELSRSKSWVSMRTGLISAMSPKVRRLLFLGKFPVYSYMYTMRQFMRLNGIGLQEIEQFVEAISGKCLSVREIEQLAHCYFRGPESFRQEIENGNLALALEYLNAGATQIEGCSEFERVLLRDLALAQKYLLRVMGKSTDSRIKSRTFYAECHLLTAGVLSRVPAFTQVLRQLHARSGQA